MKLSVVETIYETNASDVAGMLRQSADSIESETEDDDRTRAMVGVQLTEGGVIAIYGWGALDRFVAIGVLQSAITKLTDGVQEHEV